MNKKAYFLKSEFDSDFRTATVFFNVRPSSLTMRVMLFVKPSP